MEISWRPARLGWTGANKLEGRKTSFCILCRVDCCYWARLLTFLQSNRTIKTPTKKAGVGNIHGVKTLYNCPHGGRCQLHNNFLPFFLFPLVFSFWISISGQTESGRAENMREESSLALMCSSQYTVMWSTLIWKFSINLKNVVYFSLLSPLLSSI